MVDRQLPQIDGVRHRTIDVNGHGIHVAEAGEGPTLVLVHGYPEHWYGWRKLLPSLAAQYHLVCPDLRGFGWSDAPPGRYAKDEFADDIIAVIEALDVGPVGLVGHDWGGVSGYFVCLRRPDLVSRYLAVGTAHPWAPQDARTMAASRRFWYAFLLASPAGARIAARPGFVRLLFRQWSRVNGWTDADLATFVGQFAEPDRARAARSTYRTYLTRELSARPHHDDRLVTPTLHLHGRQDRCVDPALARGWEGHADDMQLEFIDGCGHFPHEERPELVLERALEFFAESTPGRAAR